MPNVHVDGMRFQSVLKIQCMYCNVFEYYRVTVIKIRGKKVKLQARRGPEGSRKLRLPNFVTTAQDGGRL